MLTFRDPLFLQTRSIFLFFRVIKNVALYLLELVQRHHFDSLGARLYTANRVRAGQLWAEL